MKRTNIRPISNIEKKAITMTGTLFLPLRIGERAWISTQTHTFMTTAVERILEISGLYRVAKQMNNVDEALRDIERKYKK